jgi:ferredoxin
MRIHFKNPNHLRTKFIQHENRKCQACWNCIRCCPNEVIEKIDFKIHKHSHIRNVDKYVGCKKCIKVCEFHAKCNIKYDLI